MKKKTHTKKGIKTAPLRHPKESLIVKLTRRLIPGKCPMLKRDKAFRKLAYLFLYKEDHIAQGVINSHDCQHIMALTIPFLFDYIDRVRLRNRKLKSHIDSLPSKYQIK